MNRRSLFGMLFATPLAAFLGRTTVQPQPFEHQKFDVLRAKDDHRMTAIRFRGEYDAGATYIITFKNGQYSFTRAESC